MVGKKDIWAYNVRYEDVQNCTSTFTICNARPIQLNPVITTSVYATLRLYRQIFCGRVETESGGTRRRTGGEVKGKEANGVGSQQSSA